MSYELSQSLTSPESAMMCFGTFQTIEIINWQSNKTMKKQHHLGALEATGAQDPASC